MASEATPETKIGSISGFCERRSEQTVLYNSLPDQGVKLKEDSLTKYQTIMAR